MQFFLYEIVARVVAIYLFFDCYELLRNGLSERKIEYVNSQFFVWYSHHVVHRDAAPVWYWMLIAGKAFSLVACVILAIFGWWHPSA